MKQDGIYAAQKIFTGTNWLYDFSVVVKNGFIVELLPTHQLNEKPNQEYHTLIPALIDLQIYGASNRLFSIYPDTETLQKLYKYCISGKTAFYLPTIGTNTYQVMYDCIIADFNYMHLLPIHHPKFHQKMKYYIAQQKRCLQDQCNILHL